MNISNAYVNVLRHVSASGKKSVVETLPQSVKQSANFKYAGPAKYKSIPIGMPPEIGGLTFEQWKGIIFKFGETKHAALNSWFNIITPRNVKIINLENEIKKCFAEENISKIEFFKTLTPAERKSIAEIGIMWDTEAIQFLSTLTGHKPAWYCEHGFHNRVDFNKIKLNPKIAGKFDVVKLPKGELFFLNKKEVLKIIEENKDLYCSLQGLNPAENLEVVYETLLKNLERGKMGQATKGESLFGITLGFPRHSSMIFEMDTYLEGASCDLRDNLPLFKKKLLELLHSEKSPYKRCPQETVEKLEKHIKEMNSIGSGSKFVCQCVTFGNEEKAVNRILQLEKDFNEKFKVEDLM